MFPIIFFRIIEFLVSFTRVVVSINDKTKINLFNKLYSIIEAATFLPTDYKKYNFGKVRNFQIRLLNVMLSHLKHLVVPDLVQYLLWIIYEYTYLRQV
jgi:hypothetical protein